jgi:PAS domain S-box-containing protein
MGDIDAARIGDLLGHDRLRDLRDNLISLLKGERRLIQTVTTFAESPSIGPVIIQARVLERNEENKALKIIGLAAALSHLSEAISGTEGGDKWRHYFQEALRQSEERVRSFIDSVDDMVYFQGIDGSLSLLNKANEHITGYTLEEFRQNPQLWREIVRSEDVEIAERFFEEHPEGVPYFEVEYRLKSKSGQWKWILSRMFASRDKSGAIIGYHCLDRDVTELKRTEELVVQTERLKAVAELATGVAHNFNNLLQILMSAAQMSFINLELDSREELKKNLNQILQSSKLGVNTVKRLQEFARLRTDLQSQETRICDLSALTEQAIEMTKSWRKKRPQQEGYSIRLESDLQRGCYIKCVESEIFEALINLIKNSAEAIHEDGLIKITTLGNDSEVQLTISDTGEGLAEEELNRIFDPFWTKKGIKGTGMGLTVSKGTIVRHGGVIEVFSSGPGNGATFKITLPPASPEVETNKAADEIGGFLSLRILLIDDIEAVLTMLKENLEKFGQKILAARSGAEGLNAIESETIDIVICDYAMPDMDGVEVAEAVRDHFISIGKQRPPFILITGWGGELPSDEELREIGVDALLEKPIDMEKLMEMAIKVVREKNKSSQIP